MQQPNNGYLYLVHCIGFPYYKIGVTHSDIDTRLSSIQTSLPFQLELEFAVLVNDVLVKEKELHSKYSQNRINGEWFNFNDSEIDTVKQDIMYIEQWSKIE
jgi:hypothetical protein